VRACPGRGAATGSCQAEELRSRRTAAGGAVFGLTASKASQASRGCPPPDPQEAPTPTLYDRCTADQIRSIVAELPSPPGLEDALRILLALLGREPATYPRAAARWGSRFTLERRLTLPDAQLTLAALVVLPEPGARADVEALAELASSYGLQDLDELLMTWAKRRGLPG
jgi:hypothetical protein